MKLQDCATLCARPHEAERKCCDQKSLLTDQAPEVNLSQMNPPEQHY